MVEKLSRILFCLAIVSPACVGQTPFHDLTAGVSTRTDVERVMGKPVKEITQTLVEYQPPAEARARVSKVYVQFRKGSMIVERIEALATQPIKRSDVLVNLHLAQRPTVTNTDANGRFLEYFGAPSYVVLTYEDQDLEKGISRTARYSRELFEAATAAIARARTDSGSQIFTSQGGDSPGNARIQSGSSSASVTRIGAPISGSWSGSWTNTKGEAGQSVVNLSEPVPGTITGDEDGWVIKNGHRSGNLLTWEYLNQNNGCADYAVRFEISADGRTANGSYKVTDRCEKQIYSGKYSNYHR